ncbi:MAG: GvpL/GvpF family gas vesicle protein [Deltaproteobacteria bacterium]|nr:GvpL/GvpF family gas vesicle protein [Deltaproteobacteria bacterium]
MAGAEPSHAGLYLYAVAAGPDVRTQGAVGLFDGKVYAIPGGRLAAVVSEVPNDRIRPERRHLGAHQEVLKKLMEEGTVLPMSFGIIADGPKAIRRILAKNHEEFARELRRVAGAVEMGLRVVWDVPNIFEYFVDNHPELRAARDCFLGNYREPTQEDKIEVGRLFDRLLKNEREAHVEKVEEVLSPRCSEIKQNPTRNEKEVMNLACLVKREALPEFETAIFEAARLFDNDFAFDYNGPWAPYNFVELSL